MNKPFKHFPGLLRPRYVLCMYMQSINVNVCKCVGGKNNFPFFLSRECLKFNWSKINVLIRRHNGPSQLFVAEFRSPPHGLLYLPPLQILTWTSCLPNIKWAVRCFITFLMWLSLVWLLSVPRYAVLTQVIFCCGLLMLQQQIEWCALNSNEEKALVYLGFLSTEWVSWKDL